MTGEDSFSSTNYSLDLHIQTQLYGPQQIVTEPPVMNSGTNVNDSNDLHQNVSNSMKTVFFINNKYFD